MPVIRPLRPNEAPLLQEFLYLAIHQPDPDVPVPRSVLQVPQVAAYASDWGRDGDTCLVAQHDGQVIGAAWARVFPGPITGYGHLDAHTPEVCMSLRPEFRGRGIGGELLRRLLDELAEAGFRRVSLSVERSNPARRLYQRLGFTDRVERAADYLMVLELGAPQTGH